ncbi:MAG TPA: isoprenylcysteine carboxylmethyltransferase family protein [Povalibacter sp.]
MNTTAMTTMTIARPTLLATVFSRRFAANYLSTLAVIGVAFWIITSLSNFHRSMLQGQWSLEPFGIDATLTIHALLVTLIALYAVILIPYYAAYPWLHSKSFVFLRGVWFMLLRGLRARGSAPAIRDSMSLPMAMRLSPAASQAGRALLLKFFFAPLMINWCLSHVADMSSSLYHMAQSADDGMPLRMLFDASLFWGLFQLILFVDTLLFTLGYIVELPALNNRIRSVDPTFFGWFICLACYPPFNEFTMRFLQWQSSDFPQFNNDLVHLAVNITLLVSLAIFSWASIALGFKASNLTNRGIVTHGPYAYVRHPAYTAKNLAWWLGALPTIGMTIAIGNWQAIAYMLLALIGWTGIYALRAITEERHLLMADNGYAEYMRKVRWRFIPGVI